jgi:hypothetical protein
MRETPKWPGNIEHSGRDPKEDPDLLGKKGYRKVLRKEEFDGTE